MQYDPFFQPFQHEIKPSREWISAMVMQGLVSNLTIGRDEYAELIAETSVKYADALLEELKNTKAPE